MLFKKKSKGKDTPEQTDSVDTQISDGKLSSQEDTKPEDQPSDEKVKGTKDKTKDKRKDKKEQTSEVPRRLYLLAEKDVPGIQGYFKGHGAPLKSLRTSVEDMKIDLLIETEPCRLIIAEAGLGKFTSTAMRAELVDLVGMCDGENKKLTVFFTNSVIKTDTHRKGFGKQGNKIDWQSYTTTLNIISYLKSLGEEYIEESEDTNETEEDTIEKKIAKLLGFKGTQVKLKVPGAEFETSAEQIAMSMAQHMEEDGLPTYKVAY